MKAIRPRNKTKFGNIKEISLNDESSWRDKIFLTFDVDWVCDDILDYTLNIIEKYDIKATFFCTHETRLLERMRKNPNIELGIHPNFNPLLNGDFKYGKKFQEVIKYFKRIVPDAVSIRAHSLTQNSNLLGSFFKNGLRYDCSCFIPYSAKFLLKPFLYWDKKLIRVPYFWEDDVHCLYDWPWKIDTFINNKELKVFNFHPIHIYLNTEKLERHEKSKRYHKNIKMLSSYINKKSYGVRQFLLDLIRKL